MTEKFAITKDAHHLWEAETEDGKLKLRRVKNLDEDAMVANLDKVVATKIASAPDVEDTLMACMGVWGATLVDDDLFTRPIAKPIVARFNQVIDNEVPKVYSWDELGKAAGHQKIEKVRKAIANGMKTRLVSKEFNVPFLVAADLIDKLDGFDKGALKEAIDAVKHNKTAKSSKYASLPIKDVATAFSRFAGMKLAVDAKAQAYFIDYFGPYGQELVAEIQRRVRSDIAYKWLRKNGVDEVAAEYWKNYFSEGGYGEALVSVIPKKLSPARD
jgi:hypothetical protein